MIKKRKMKRPTKQQLYDIIEEYKKIIDVYEKILNEFKIEKVKEETCRTPYSFGQTAIKRLYKQGEKHVYVAIMADDENLYLYGVGKDEE